VPRSISTASSEPLNDDDDDDDDDDDMIIAEKRIDHSYIDGDVYTCV